MSYFPDPNEETGIEYDERMALNESKLEEFEGELGTVEEMEFTLAEVNDSDSDEMGETYDAYYAFIDSTLLIEDNPRTLKQWQELGFPISREMAEAVRKYKLEVFEEMAWVATFTHM